MVCSIQARVALVALVIVTGAFGRFMTPAQSRVGTAAAQGTVVTVRWGARAGVSRYRLQLAQDAAFNDVVFDRVVTGHEYSISDLTPGKYFWRVASLTARVGEFSSAGVIEVPPPQVATRENSTNTTLSQRTTDNARGSAISTSGGWYAAIGSVSRSIVAYLRSRDSSNLVVTTDDGRVVALDTISGRAMWIVRLQGNRPGTAALTALPLAVPARSGSDNVIVLSNAATLIDGATGRILWQMKLPAIAARATTLGEKILVLDNSLRRLMWLSAIDGRTVADVRFARPVVGTSAAFVRGNTRRVIVALDDGRVQLLDEFGKQMREGNVGSPATTAPLIVRTARGDLLLVGTSNGLTALNADDLRPLGRVTLKEGAPRGTLAAQDLDRDGVAEVVMFTDRGRVVVVKSDEGKIVWEGDAKQAESVAFADVDRDGVIDLLMTGREEFAFALSGRDGAMIWKSDSMTAVATNHAPARLARSPLIVQTASGVLLIASDASSGGLRALEFHHRPGTAK